MIKQNAMVTPLDKLWDSKELAQNRSIEWHKKLLMEHRDNLEFPIHIGDIVRLGLIGTPVTKDNYFIGNPEEYSKIKLIPVKDWVLSTTEGAVNYFPNIGPSYIIPFNACQNNIFSVLPLDELTQAVLHPQSLYKWKTRPVYEKMSEGFRFIGWMPLHECTKMRDTYFQTYLDLLMLNVKSKKSISESILIRKSAEMQFKDTILDIPQRYFHLPHKTYHFINESAGTSYMASIKRGELQIVKIKECIGDGLMSPNEAVLEIMLEDITDKNGNINKKSIKKGLQKVIDKLNWEGSNYDKMCENIDQQYELGSLIYTPHVPVLLKLLTGATFGPSSGMNLQISETQYEWLENWCQEVQFIIKLIGFMQDPRQKDIIKRDTILYRKEYKRGTKLGDEIKYKVWGQNVSLIRNDSKTTGEKNRSHHVEGHNRKQPIKEVKKYEEMGYVVNNPHDDPFVDMYIEPHWRGDKELGELTTILMFGRQSSGWSRKGIDWLQSISAKEKIDIKHALNGGEYAFSLGRGKMARVDGFCKETNTVYEFYGDYYHGNPKKYGADEYNKTCKKTHGELYEKTMKREQAIKSLGFNFVCIWECDFDNLRLVK